MAKFIMSQEEWLQDFKKKLASIDGMETISFNDKDFVNMSTSITFYDHALDLNGKEYGEYKQTPSLVLLGRIHPQHRADTNTIKRRKTMLKEFIEKASKMPGHETIDYSKVVYIDDRTDVLLIDHDVRPDGTEYGEFYQKPYNHLRGQGHPDKKGLKIKKALTGVSKKDGTSFNIIDRFHQIHNPDEYDYSEVVYNGMDTPVRIYSRHKNDSGEEYGWFEQTPRVHLLGCGHPMEGVDKMSKARRMSNEEYIRRATEAHKGYYTYANTKYFNETTNIIVTCPKHGDFSCLPGNHLYHLKGCPRCGASISKAEEEIALFIKDKLGFTIEQRNRKILNGLELDIYVPSKGLAIEYNGLKWHNDSSKPANYHLEKTLACKAQGISLIHIFEDEWKLHKDLVLDKLTHFLGVDSEKIRIGARKCTIREISSDEAKDFLEVYHMQGSVSATVYLGAYYNEALVGVMSFKAEDSVRRNWDLNRFATDVEYSIPGLGSKLFKYFIRNYGEKETVVKSFLDRRWCLNEENNVYTCMGFKFDSYLSPEYRYWRNDSDERMHKFGFRKNRLLKLYPDILNASMTEREMTEALGYTRIYDCGLIKYIWKNQPPTN